MGVAAVLIVPTLITAANPELAYAKTTSSKKVSAKAKSVIAKIKAINPKKSNYVTKTKSAVNAYKKLSSKDKKMVYNYGTLKKHWTIVQNRKAKQVIASIKAINPKKSDYVLKTKSALSAYNKLSKTDKKKVTNYSTLKKHWKNIQPYLKKVDAFNKSVATLNKTNFTTKSVTLEKQYDNLDSITKAAVPSTTVKKLSYYSDVVETKKLVFRTLEVGSTNESNTNNGSDTSSNTTPEDGTKILTIINAYNKLSGAQKTLLDDLLTADSSNTNTTDEEKKETARNNLKRYLALEDLIKIAAGIEKKYSALQPLAKAKAKDLYDLYFNEYEPVADKTISYTDKKDYKLKDFIPEEDFAVIDNIDNAYSSQKTEADTFTEKVNGLSSNSSSSTDIAGDNGVIKLYTELQKPKTASIAKYPYLAPIDLVDKKTITTYNKFAPIPALVDNLKDLNLSPLNSLTPGSLKTSEVSTLADLLTQYNKLGSDQKSIVRNGLTSNNAKDYLSEAKNISSAQSIDKIYDSALKNSSKPSYFLDLLKVKDTYNNASPEVKRFVVVKTNDIEAKLNAAGYDAAKTAVDDFSDSVNSIPSANDAKIAIDKVISQYNTISAKPSWLALVDKNVLKTYNEYAKVPNVLNLVSKIRTPYTAKQIANIISAIKGYKKLGTTQKQIVDSKYPDFSNLVEDESNISAAQKIDNAYLKLKKSSKTYPKDAKAVYEAYDDSLADIQKYVVNKNKIEDLENTYKDEKTIANDFETKVNKLSKNSKIADVDDVVEEYNKISTNPKASSLVDKTVMKKYNEYAPVSNVVKLLSLIKESNVDSSYVTPTDVIYIQKSTIAYNALKPDPKMIIDDASRAKFPFLYDGKYIKEAAEIDKAFEKVKPTDDKYEKELLDVYYEYYDRAPFVKKYVAHKKELEEIGNIYKEPLAIAKEFETKVRNLSHISESGYTPTIKTVRNVEKYYFDNIKYNKINAKYNIPLSTLIPDDVMETYNKYALVLQIQDIAKSIYVLYGKLFNNENVEFDKEKDYYYYSCNDALNKQSDRCYSDEYYENAKKGYTDSGKKAGNPIKITNPNDIKLIYKAIDYYQQLDAEQRAVLDKAPSSLTDTYYKDRFGGNTEPNTEEGDVHPSIPMSTEEIKNFLKAQEIDKEYEALKPSSKTYINDAIALYYKFYKAGRKVQLYVIHEKDLNDFKDGFGKDPNNKLKKLIDDVDNFIRDVKLLSNDSEIENIVNNVINKLGVVNQYNNFNEAQLSVLEQGVLTKYNMYAPIAEIMELSPTIPASDKSYSDADINNMLKAISIYKKLAKDPKAIVVTKLINSSESKYKYLNHEKEIKAAQKVDNAFKKLDKTDDKYVTNLKKVETAYNALADLKLSGFTDKTAKVYVTSTSNINEAIGKNIYKDPKTAAEKFKNSVDALLDMYPITYNDVKDLVDEYNSLNSKAKSLVDSNTLKIYNKYTPIVDIVETLKKVQDGDIPDDTKIKSWAESEKDKSDLDLIKSSDATGYYKKKYSKKDVGSEILNAIQLYNKLGSDQKDIVQNKVQPANPGDTIPTNGLTDKQKGLLNETNNIKAAQALDKKIAAIKPKSTGYVKGVIDATKTLNVMPIEQRIYLQNVDVLKGYLEDSNSQKTQTQKAIDDLTKFEKGVKQVDQWTSEMDKDSNGNITGTCTTDDTKSPASTTTCSSTLITNQMNALKTQFDQLNTPRLIDGSEVKLASLIDRTILARYQYFRAIYDVIDGLEK